MTPIERVREALDQLINYAQDSNGNQYGSLCASLVEHIAQQALSELDGIGWQQIETAPKDETVLIKTPFYECPAFFDKSDGEWFFPRYNNEYWEVTEPVLNWMPLPDAPYVEGEKE